MLIDIKEISGKSRDVLVKVTLLLTFNRYEPKKFVCNHFSVVFRILDVHKAADGLFLLSVY